MYTDRLAALSGSEARLLLGRLDTATGPTWIGRIGLTDESQKVLQIDWRAPAAAPLLQATAASPQGVRSRRHITTDERRVVGLSDGGLDPPISSSPDTVDSGSDSALLRPHSAPRAPAAWATSSPRSRPEQDRIIHSGGQGRARRAGQPGTGKTAVALHRAATLLYTHRDRLEQSGMLVLGPTGVFLRYVEAILHARRTRGWCCRRSQS